MGGSHVVNIELSVFPPASLLSRQAKLFCAAVDVKSSLLCLCLFSLRNSQGPEFAAPEIPKKKAVAGSGWKMDQEMNSRREERVKLVIFLAHGCNYAQSIPEAFL